MQILSIYGIDENHASSIQRVKLKKQNKKRENKNSLKN